MITWNEMAKLLKLCTVFDQRTVGAEDIKAWLVVAQLEGWDKQTVERVIIEHYSCGAERPRITPAQISDSLRRLRRQAATTFEDPVIPDGYTGAQYVRWYREQLREHIDQTLVRWAAGEDIPLALPQPPPPSQRVEDAIKAFAERTRIPADDPEIRYQPQPALRVECPHCGAEPGEACTRPGLGSRRRTAKPHPSRTEAAP